MSQENVDRFIEVTDAFNRMIQSTEALNRTNLRGLLALMDPEVQFEPQQATLEGGYAGHEGVQQWFADLAEHYQAGSQLHYADIRDLDDRVLGIGTLRVTGMGSGIAFEAPIAVVASFRNGLITHFKDYGDKDLALEAAGVRE